MKRKIFNLFLILIMVMVFSPVVHAEDKPDGAEWLVYEGENHVWYKIEGTTLTIGGSGAMPNWKSNATGENSYSTAPWYGETIMSIIIAENDNVTKIGEYAFVSCESLVSIKLAQSVETIGTGAFRGCSKLNTIEFNDTLKYIDPGAFNGCAFTSLTFPEGLIRIGGMAFQYNDKLTEIVLPSSLNDIQMSAFSMHEVNALKEITSYRKDALTLGANVFKNVSIDKLIIPMGSNQNYISWSIYDEEKVSYLYTITFNTNGGNEIKSVMVEQKNKLVKPTNPTKENYVFDGWYQDITLNVPFDFDTPIKNDVTLYAKWTANEYKVTFDANGGTVTPSNKNVTFGSTYGELPIPTRTGYTFTGWYTEKDSGTEIKSDTTVAITEEQTLYAKWTANEYNITITTNDENMGSAVASVDKSSIGTQVTLSILPNDGYHFVSWETKDAEITNNKFTMPAKNVTIKAIFEKNYVAQIGTEKYETLTDAIVSVTDTTPTTIKLINDIINEPVFAVGIEGSTPVKQNITIDLDGYKIVKDNSTGNGSIFTVIGYGTLTIDDTSNEKKGLITSGNSGRMRGVDVARGTFILKNGTITGSTKDSKWSGAGVNVWSTGTFIMEGGSIENCYSGKHGGGVHIENSGGVFTMKGGTIKNNISTGWGGGVCNGSNFTMEGGTIENNTTSNGGGGITTSGTFTMTGGIIKENTANGNTIDDSGGGVCGDGTLTIGGSAVIINNKWKETTNNFYLRNNRYIILDNPKTDMNIGIIMQNSMGKFTTNGLDNNIGLFTPDNSDYAVRYNKSGYLELAIGYNIIITVNDKSMGTASANFKKAAAGSQISLTATPKPGYAFVKWESEDVTITNNKFTMPTKNVTIKAIFEEDEVLTYKVSFDKNGGTGSMDDVTGLTGTYTLPENEFVAPDGKQFKGWSLSNDGEIVTKLNIDEDKIVYAIWEDIPEDYSYEFKKGDKQELTIDNIDSFTFTIDGDYSLFDSLKVGNLDLIKDEDYIVTEGSTIITFTNKGIAKLNTLEKGTYDILVTYSNGKNVTGSLILNKILPQEPDTPNPKTGDNITSYLIIGSLSLISLFGSCLYLNRKRFN